MLRIRGCIVNISCSRFVPPRNSKRNAIAHLWEYGMECIHDSKSDWSLHFLLCCVQFYIIFDHVIPRIYSTWSMFVPSIFQPINLSHRIGHYFNTKTVCQDIGIPIMRLSYNAYTYTDLIKSPYWNSSQHSFHFLKGSNFYIEIAPSISFFSRQDLALLQNGQWSPVMSISDLCSTYTSLTRTLISQVSYL